MAMITGTMGDDTLDNNVGEFDTIDGLDGNDTVSYAGAGGGAGVIVDLSFGQAFDLINGDVDTLISIENIIGSSFDDILTGDIFANVLDGAAGNDLLVGGDGADTASYASALLHGATVDLGTGTASDGDGGMDALFEIENISGSAFGDSLTGDGNANAIDGRGGDDAIRGAGGNDNLTGGAGADVFHYSFNVTPGAGETFSFTKYFAAHGGQVVNGEVADGTSQGQFSSLYTKWLNMLIAEEGLGTKLVDLGQNSGAGGEPVIKNMTGEFGERESFTWTSGSGKKAVVHERWYSDTWSSGSGGDTVTSTDGLDTILDFGAGDKLGFSGITLEQFLANFNADASSNVAGGSAVDTVITIDGFDGWSLTLADVSRSLADVANDINFS